MLAAGNLKMFVGSCSQNQESLGCSAEFAKGRFKAVCSIVFAESGGDGSNAELAK